MDQPNPSPALRGNVKVLRDDWLVAAIRFLVTQGIENVRILTLAQELGVSRSSFYWYFRDREDLLDALLDHWRQTNTQAILVQAAKPASSVAQAVTNVFDCWRNIRLFDPQLDFAVREWGRRSDSARAAVMRADAERIAALTDMFARFDIPAKQAIVRARTLYFSQIGYYVLQVSEPQSARDDLLSEYVFVHAGEWPTAAEITDFLTRQPS